MHKLLGRVGMDTVEGYMHSRSQESGVSDGLRRMMIKGYFREYFEAGGRLEGGDGEKLCE